MLFIIDITTVGKAVVLKAILCGYHLAFSLVMTFILVNFIYQKYEEFSIHIILDVIAVLSFYRILTTKR